MSSLPPAGMRTFLIVWFGQLVSVLGSGLTHFGIGVWIYQRSGSATQFALAMVFYTIPGILLLPVAGSVVDRWDRRKAMLLSDVGSGSASILLAFLALTGNLALWEIYALMAISSAFQAFMWPAFSASISTLVPKEHYGRANGLGQLSEASSMILGPTLGAILFAFGGLGALLAVDATSYLIAIGTLLIVRIPRPAPLAGAKPSIWSDAKLGWTYIARRAGLLHLLMLFLALNFTLGMTNVLLMPMFLTFFDVKQAGYLMTAFGCGMLLGSMLMGAWGGPKKRITGAVSLIGLFGLLLCAYAFPPSMVLYGAIGVLGMVTVPIVNGSLQAVWQAKVEHGLQGRVFATRRMVAWFMTPVAMGLAGPLADKVFKPAMMDGGALASTLGVVLGTGEGAGYRALFLLVGLATMGIAFAGLADPRIRNLEAELPDAVETEAPAPSEPLHEPEPEPQPA